MATTKASWISTKIADPIVARLLNEGRLGYTGHLLGGRQAWDGSNVEELDNLDYVRVSMRLWEGRIFRHPKEGGFFNPSVLRTARRVRESLLVELRSAGLTVNKKGAYVRIECTQQEAPGVVDIVAAESFDRLFKVYAAKLVDIHHGINIYEAIAFGYLDLISGPTLCLGLHKDVFLVGSCSVEDATVPENERKGPVVSSGRMRPTLRKAQTTAENVARHRLVWDDYVLNRDALAREQETIRALKAAELPEPEELSDEEEWFFNEVFSRPWTSAKGKEE